jgi:hypothetical protein
MTCLRFKWGLAMDRKHFVYGAVVIIASIACQNYEFVFQPDTDRQAAHLRFAVKQPSKADILFVIDNSKSMAEEQQALEEAFDKLLEALAAQDTRYRIGIVSTDSVGFEQDCVGTNIVHAQYGNGGKGNCCPSCNCIEAVGTQACDVQLRRPHDGVKGRLIAAYDPSIFNISLYQNDLTSAQLAALEKQLPTGAYTGHPEAHGQVGARAVIDREEINRNACSACGCEVCEDNDSCYIDCAKPVASTLVKAFFRANVRALGIHGFGWEEGIESALLAIGIDPEIGDDASALTPAYDLTLPGAPNNVVLTNQEGSLEATSWLRSDAMLAVMFVSDEEDCSMPNALLQLRQKFEEGASPAQPTGSMCYQELAQAQFLSTARIRDLLVSKKGSGARVAMGFIGGVKRTGVTRDGEAVDCITGTGGIPSSACSCLAGALIGGDPDQRWCTLGCNIGAVSSFGGRSLCDACTEL